MADDREELMALRRMAELEAKAEMPVREQIIPSPMQTQRNKREQLTQDRLLYSPTVGMGTGERVAAGAKKFLTDRVLGAGANLGLIPRSEVIETQERDAPLMETSAGQAGNMGMAALATLPLGMVRGANTLLGSGLIGSAIGASEPATSYDEAAKNTLISGGVGAVSIPIGRALSGSALVPNSNNPVTQNLVDTAVNKYGMAIPASTRTGSKALGFLESQMATLPGGGAMATALNRPREQLAELVMEQAGHRGPATTATLQSARAGTSAGYNRVWQPGTTVQLDQQFNQDVQGAVQAAQRMMSPADQAILSAQIDNITNRAANGAIPGDVYQQAIRGELRRATPQQGALRYALEDVRGALDAAAQRSIGPALSDDLARLNRQTAVRKSIEPIIPAAEARGGTFTPSGLLPSLGGFSGDVGELARLGPLLREPPNSGTATRQIMSSGLPGMLMMGPNFVGSQILSRPGVQNYLANGAGLGILSPMQGPLELGVRSGILGGLGLINAQ